MALEKDIHYMALDSIYPHGETPIKGCYTPGCYSESWMQRTEKP